MSSAAATPAQQGPTASAACITCTPLPIVAGWTPTALAVAPLQLRVAAHGAPQALRGLQLRDTQLPLQAVGAHQAAAAAVAAVAAVAIAVAAATPGTSSRVVAVAGDAEQAGRGRQGVWERVAGADVCSQCGQ